MANERAFNVMGRRISRRLIPYVIVVFLGLSFVLYLVSNSGQPSWEEQKKRLKYEEKVKQVSQLQPGTKTEIQEYISKSEKEIADKKKAEAERIRLEEEKKRAAQLEAAKNGLIVAGGVPAGVPPAMDGKSIDPVEMKRLADARNASMSAATEAALFEDYGNGVFGGGGGNSTSSNPNNANNGAVPNMFGEAEQRAAKMQEQQRQREADRRAADARMMAGYAQQQAQAPRPSDGSVQGWQGERAASAMKPTKALMPEPAPSPYLLRQGATIPVVLGQEINSQLPGQIGVRVIRDIYDGLRAKYLLIPKNSKLIGEYRSEMAVGEERLMIVFTRILLPDGRSIRLPAMPGADAMGRMGVEGEVNSRFWRVFGPSFLIAAATKMSMPDTPSGTTINYYGTGQTWQGVAAQTLSDTSKKIIERYQKAGPYIVIPAGEVINVIVTQDIAIPPGAAFATPVNYEGQF